MTWLAKRLEPDDGKLSSPVLRGERGSNASDLLGNIGSWVGMACLVELKSPKAVMVLDVEPSGVYDTPLSLVNAQLVTESSVSQRPKNPTQVVGVCATRSF